VSIKLENVVYTYMQGTPYERVALQNINLEIHPGEFIGIIGHTGSGKSTLIQHFNGLLKPTSGCVRIDDIDLHQNKKLAKQAKRKVGMVFQYPEHQLFEETVFADIAFGPRNLGLSEEEVDFRVRKAMQFVGLNYDTVADRSPFQLSGGQMRRIAIAGVIATEPEYLILDEPSAGLDPRGRREIFSQIKNLHAAAGNAVVLVTHNMEDVLQVATRLIVMSEGRILLDDKPETLFWNYHEQLVSVGVDVPHIISLLKKLRAAGLAVGECQLTVEAAATAICEALGGQSRAE